MRLNSKNKTILVISDCHQEIDRLEYILANEKYDVAVNLGDYYDSFHFNSESDVRKTSEFLKHKSIDPNYYSLWGNHDLQYFYDNKYTGCSGYFQWKHSPINEIFGSDLLNIRDKFLWYIWIDDFLCTHAGLHQNFIPPMTDIKNISDFLDVEVDKANTLIQSNQPHWFYMAGAGRGGNMKYGGLTWLDFRREFVPIEGLKQIVGHTRHHCIVNHNTDGNINISESENIDIDCGLTQYLLIRNGKVTVKTI